MKKQCRFWYWSVRVKKRCVDRVAEDQSLGLFLQVDLTGDRVSIRHLNKEVLFSLDALACSFFSHSPTLLVSLEFSTNKKISQEEKVGCRSHEAKQLLLAKAAQMSAKMTHKSQGKNASAT